MRFPSRSATKLRFLCCRVLAFAGLLTAANCRAQVTSNADQAQSGLEKLRVVSSVPLPDFWKKMGNSDRTVCSKDADLLFQLVPGELADMGHEIARVGANGAMLGYFDLRQSPGFEKATIRQATFDSSGRIVLLVTNLLAAEVRRTDAEGRPRGMLFREDHTRWVLTVDDNGGILRKFSFKDSLVAGERIALFNNGNALVTGFVDESAGGVIFSSEGTVLAKVRLPALEDQASTSSNEQSATTATQISGARLTGGAGAAGAALRRPPMLRRILVPFAGGDDEIFLVELADQPFLFKVSADGRLGKRVKLAVPEDERVSIERIAGHRALALISSAQRLPAGTVTKSPEWKPMAIFDVESGALLETMLLSMHESGPVCYSGSGLKAIGIPGGTLDTLEK